MTEVAYLRAESAPDAPHMIEAEQAVLGTLLLDAGSLLPKIMRCGGVDLFFDPLHAEIFNAIAEKDRLGFMTSPITILDVMRGNPGLEAVGGGGYLVRLAGVGLHAAAPAYVEMLADMHHKRRIVAAMSEAQASIARGDVSAGDVAGRLEAALVSLTVTDAASGPVSMLSAVKLAMEQVHAAYTGDTTELVTSGIPELDRMISGFYPGELILIGGRPSMGKTGVALSMALNAARAGHGVVIASLEMNPEAMALRALAEATSESRYSTPFADMRRGDMSADQIHMLKQAAIRVAELPITFLPRSYADIGALLSGAKQAQRAMKGKMRLLIVDYAQLLRSQAKSRYEQITEISIALKALAGQLNVPVVALSQLSRSLESRDDKRPMLSDLRESGQLEQDADAVLFCYRDEYYLERERPQADDLDATADWMKAMDKAHNRLEIIVAKQRQGEIGIAKVRFNPALNLIWSDGE